MPKRDYNFLLNAGTEELVSLFVHENPAVARLAQASCDGRQFASALAEFIDSDTVTLSTGMDAEVRRCAMETAKHLSEMAGEEGREVTDLSTGAVLRLSTFSTLRELLTGIEASSAVPVNPSEETLSTAPDSTERDFMLDILFLFGLLRGDGVAAPGKRTAEKWARRWPDGLDAAVAELRRRNRERIIELLIERVDQRSPQINQRYFFPEGASHELKRELIEQWWSDFRFHLAMAIRSPRELNRYLDGSLSESTLTTLADARQKGMPFFITPYYASLLDVSGSAYDDLAMRSYVIYSRELVESYGNIRAWEREDEVRDGEPNAAGWLIPEGGNIHRRYPEVAILIPDSMGRACGGLCAPCQRMYDFQRRRLSFEFGSLRPNEHWNAKLRRLMHYFAEDAQLRDILITGGDALMSQNSTLRNILDAVLRMAARKRHAAGVFRTAHDKGANISDLSGNDSGLEEAAPATIDRVRLGTRIPVYLPMRVDDELVEILANFRRQGMELGIRQFVIQTHFESPLEMTPESRRAIVALQSAGWLVTNQLVFTAAASRRGHVAALRRTLSREGILPYYTFSVKGFDENAALVAPNSRSLQEQHEEKVWGTMTRGAESELVRSLDKPERLSHSVTRLMKRHGVPFLATDRNVMNLPGIGKSMTFRTAGLTRDGRRILCFAHDHTRRHSPVVESMGRVFITENRPVASYLRRLVPMGECIADYASVWQYLSGETELRFEAFEYP